ncbi:uncharacterized protein [Typha angustifolia]|uniref:uncharacterized protein n=1 Tax=Typha angustifolia TaxID=59011 RepID=UPI003C2BB730
MEFTVTDLLSNEKNPLVRTSVTEKGHILMSGENDSLGDSILSLSCSGYGTNQTNETFYLASNHNALSQDDDHHLVLGLGPTRISCHSDNHAAGASKSKESASFVNPSRGSESDSEMLELGLASWNGDSTVGGSPYHLEDQTTITAKNLLIPVVDENSTSAKRISGGYMPSLLYSQRNKNFSDGKGMPKRHALLDLGSNLNAHQHEFQFSLEPVAATTSSAGIVSDSPIARRTRKHHLKRCMFQGCLKGARGASMLCISHGGGQRCQRPGCNKGAESSTPFCKGHGGGRRCQQLGCTKSAEGKTELCIAHGGGQRCGHPGCTKAARGRSGLCIKHGGGKRCTIEGCTRSAEGQAGLCISHGGGRRCQYPECGKGAQGGTKYCKGHGGGRRCIFQGCTKGAEGSTSLCKGHGGGRRCIFEGGGVCPKSVHGGTNYCVAHGGGKRCSVPGCTKSARGATDCCVKHGGGKRCRFAGCTKSAQGRTDFCKTHGGGKRCTWISGCDKFSRGKSGLCAAHGTIMSTQQEFDAGNNRRMISSGLFQGLVSSSTTVRSSVDYANLSLSGVTAGLDRGETLVSFGKRQLLIPPQMLIPTSMKSLSSPSTSVDIAHGKIFEFVVPEGRVHGGSLMTLLKGTLKNAVDGGSS